MRFTKLNSTKFILFCATWAYLSSSQVEARSLTAPETQALQVIKDYAAWLNRANGELLQGLKHCLVDPRAPLVADSFVKRVKAATGADLSETLTCSQMRSKYFGTPGDGAVSFRRDFRSMQYYAILAQSGTTLSSHAYEAGSIDSDLDQKFPAYEHPIRGLTDRVMTMIEPMPKPEPIVWQQAVKTYDKDLRDTCLAYEKTHQATIEMQLGKFRARPFFKNLCGVLTRKSNPELTWQESVGLGVVHNDLADFAMNRRKKFRAENLEKYLQIVSERPQFLLMNASNLDREAMIGITRRMISNQTDYAASLSRELGSSHLKLVRLTDSNGETITQLISRHMNISSARASQIVLSLKSEEATRTFRKDMLWTGGAIAVGAACALSPFGRASVIFRSLCFVTIGLPFDVGYLTISALARRDAFQALASSPDFDYVIGSTAQITEENRSVLFSLVLMPLNLSSLRKPLTLLVRP